ncbi:MAG: C40 family peptidase [Pseudomonadota bacterium]
MLIGICTLAACSWQAPDSQPSATATTQATTVTQQAAPQTGRNEAPVQPDRGIVAATVAQQQIGVRYQYGGSDPSGFDCSGLVRFAYQQAGLTTPRTTGELWQAVKTVPESQIRAGDLLFFDIGGKPSHVGIYVGDGYFVHAPSTGRVVSRERVSSEFYRRSLVKVGRPIP